MYIYYSKQLRQSDWTKRDHVGCINMGDNNQPASIRHVHGPCENEPITNSQAKLEYHSSSNVELVTFFLALIQYK